MKPKTKPYRNLVAVAGMFLLGFGIAGAKADSLYIGEDAQAAPSTNPDGSETLTIYSNTIKRFDARTGDYQGVFVTNENCPNYELNSVTGYNSSSPPPLGCLYGPTGLVFDGSGHLLVADQNVNLPVSGAIYEYKAQTGAFVKALVSYNDANAPPAPRGMVLYNGVLFVASFTGLTTTCNPNDPQPHGKDVGNGCIQAFDASTGNFLYFLPSPPDLAKTSSFHPRGVVIGPDGLLYVSNVPVGTNAKIGPAGNGGQILVYDPKTSSLPPATFVGNETCDPDASPPCEFNRPEGLVFGPDGNLYVTSFQSNPPDPTDPYDTDKILIFAGPGGPNPGSFIGQIVLDSNSADQTQRASAQALLFGSNDELFVPVNRTDMNLSAVSGDVRLYDVQSRSFSPSQTTFTSFVTSEDSGLPLSGQPLTAAWYLTFGNTDPATLAYQPQGNNGEGHQGN